MMAKPKPVAPAKAQPAKLAASLSTSQAAKIRSKVNKILNGGQ